MGFKLIVKVNSNINCQYFDINTDCKHKQHTTIYSSLTHCCVQMNFICVVYFIFLFAVLAKVECKPKIDGQLRQHDGWCNLDKDCIQFCAQFEYDKFCCKRYGFRCRCSEPNQKPVFVEHCDD